MGKEIANPKDDRQWKKELGRIADALRKKGTPTTPVPTELTKPEHFLKFEGTNALKFDPTGFTMEDLPMKEAFAKTGMSYASKVFGYLSFMIKNAPTKKRKAVINLEKDEDLRSGKRDLDVRRYTDRAAAEVAWTKAAWDNNKKRVVLGVEKFTKRGGDRAFWEKLKDDERAAKVLAAKVAESLRRSTRVRRPTKHYNPAAAAEQTGASPEDGNYPHLGVEKHETVCRIILGEGGEEALKALGVDWVCGAWQSETVLEMTLRGLMEYLSRILTIGAVTTKVHCDLALAALERELDKRLATWYASLAAPPVAPLRASNRDALSLAAAACAVAPAVDGALGRGRAAARFATRTARDDAASALGDRAEMPSMEVRLAAARVTADAAGAGHAAPRVGKWGSADGGQTRKRLAAFCTAVLESATSSAGAPTHRRLVRCGNCEACRKRAGEPCRAPVPLVPSSVSARSVLARVDAALAEGGASGLAAATRIAADAAPRVDLDLFLAVVIYAPPPSEMTFKCEMQFHTPGVEGWNGWADVSDFFAVYEALRVHRSFSSPAWLGASSTLRAFETSGQQILAGKTLAEMTAPKSVCAVFDQEECEGVKYRTYTIFIGSDYQIRERGRAPIDKCACLVEAIKAYMASRAAA